VLKRKPKVRLNERGREVCVLRSFSIFESNFFFFSFVFFEVSANDSSTIVTIPLDVIQALEIIICFYVVLEAIEIVIVCGHNAKLIAKKCFRRLPGSLFAAGCYVMLNLQLYHFTQLWFAGSPGLYDKLSTEDWQNIHYFGVVAVVFYNFLFISNENINWRALELEEDPVAQQKKTDSVVQDDKKRSSSESSLSFKTHKVPYRIALPDRFTPVLIWFVERSATFLETELPSGALWLSDPVNIITPLCGFIGVVSSFLLMLFPGALWTFDSHSHLIFHAILIAVAQGTLMLA